MTTLLRMALRAQRRASVGWAIGLASVAAMYAAFYPSIRESSAEFRGYVEKLPEAIRELLGGDFTTPAGYLRSETFSILGPVLFLVFAIGVGARAIAGEEENRTLDLVLSTPVRRREVLVAKWTSLLLASLALATTLGLTIAIVGPLFDLRIAIANLAAACISLLLLGLAFGTVALAVGCLTGRRSLAYGITGAVATISYVTNVLAQGVEQLSPLRPLSPFRWYLEPDPLVHGINAASMGVLAAITVVAYSAAWVSFERRDLRA